MRERVRHGEVDQERCHEWAVRGGRAAARRPRAGRVGVWRPGPGPRPVRPAAAPVAVRPPEAPRPVDAPGRPVAAPRWVERVGQRLIARRPSAVVSRCGDARHGVRRAVAVLALATASAAAVVALGLLAVVSRPAGPPAAVPVSSGVVTPAPVVVTAAPGETVWDVVDRVAPAASGPGRAALAERIVVDNGLGSVRLRPGQVLRVAPG